MWLIAMFDMPTETKIQRDDYVRFRKGIMKDGFSMMQYSVYIRHCASEENAAVHHQRIRACLAPEGEVRVLAITDKQFGRMQVFVGKKRRPAPSAPTQIELF
ncbi:MAG: CRISPR-associated endonuclease Cas2 [Deltaproteobacteria bacterium]|nr:CRISPR-associated endonuclease Cas2 [Deltaproteobacteria bacterium]